MCVRSERNEGTNWENEWKMEKGVFMNEFSSYINFFDREHLSYRNMT